MYAYNVSYDKVLNTDAEGRLTLADALVYAEKIGGVDTIVDLATLTGNILHNTMILFHYHVCMLCASVGACIVGLGEKVAGLYASDSKLSEDLTSAAKVLSSTSHKLSYDGKTLS